jgi:hypothetical protein
MVERLAEQPCAALREPAPVHLAARLLAAAVEHEPPAPVAPQLAVAVALAQPRQPQRVQHATDSEVDGRALDRIGEGRLRVGALTDVLARYAEQRQPTAHVDRRRLAHLACTVHRHRDEPLQQRLEAC